MKTQKRMKRNVPEFQPQEPKIIESANVSAVEISESVIKSLNIISHIFFKKYYNNYIYEINFPIDCLVKQIKYNSFKFLHLYSISFPPSLSILLPQAFKGCHYLNQIQFNNNESSPNNLTFICDKAFKDTKISSIILPSNVKEIGSLCFPTCISKIELENGLPALKKIGDSAFSGTQITSFNMPINMMPFVNAKNVFFNCKQLKVLIFDSFPNTNVNINENEEEEKRKNKKIKFIESIKKEINNNKNISNDDLYESVISQDFAKSLLLSQISIEKIEVLSSNLNYFYFFNTPNLNSIIVPKNDKAKYIVHHGCLYTKDKKKLIIAQRNISKSIICSKCQIISNYAFNIKHLEKVSFENNSELKEISFLAFYDSQIKCINIPNCVDFIDYGAFYNCKLLEKINITNSMFLIDFFTFSYTNLKEILIPKGIVKIKFGSFLGCSNLKKIEFEKESILNEIDDYAFAYTKIESIFIPKNVKRLGNYCFYGCYELKFVKFEDNLSITNIGSNCFVNTQIDESEIFQNIKTVDLSFKKGNDDKIYFMKPNIFENITYISIPSNVDEICFHAFFDCQSLKRVEIIDPKNSKLKRIASGAFYNCKSLIEFDIPKNIGYFGNDSFKNCIKFQSSIHLTNEEKILIGNSAFENSGINSFFVKSNDLVVKDFSFQNCSNLNNFSANVLQKCCLGNSSFKNCKSLEKVKINQNVQKIKICENCFMSSSIKEFEVPLNLNMIHASSFKFCKQLKKVLLNENSNINYFGSEAFYESGIQKIFITGNVKIIDRSCFEKCKELKILEFAPNICNCIIKEKAFSMTGIAELTIPIGIKQILYSCFENCSNLKIVNFSDNSSNMIEIDDNVFKSTRIKSLTIPPSIKKVGRSSFQNCKNLKNVNFLGNNVTIFPSSFYQCNQIESFTFKSVIQICDFMFSDYVYFFKSDEINNIKDLLVKNEQIIKYHHACLSFSHILIDEKSIINPNMKLNHNHKRILTKKSNRELEFVKHLNNGYYSQNLKEIYFCDLETESIVIPKETIVISLNAFHYSLLTKIDFENCSNLEIIGKSSFEDLLIEEITIPNSVLLIGENAFKNCKKLKKVNISIDSKLTKIKIGAFDNTAIEKMLFPSTLTDIEDFAFYQCLKLKEIDNHSNQIAFGYKSFYHSAIKDIKFPSKASFYISAFQGCTNLEKLSFLSDPKKLIFDVQSFASSGLKSISFNCKVDIYENAFSFCDNLKKVILEGNDIKCLYNSFDSPNITEFALTLKVELNEKKFNPKKHFLFIKDKVILSSLEKFYLNLTFHNKNDPNEYKQNFYYNQNCFVIDDELYYANLINNIDLYQYESMNNDDENSLENKVEEIKKNEILKLPKNVKKLNFQEMSHLKKIKFDPYSLVDNLGPPGLFSYYSLVEISIPKLVKKIPPHSFENCHFLENVYFEKGSLLIEIGEFSFSNTKINKIKLPDSVNIIKHSAFAFNNNLKTVDFKGEIIEKEAFLHTGLVKFKLSNNTRFIGSNAFQYCHDLSEFEIDINDSNLSEINDYAFSDTAIIEINIPSNIKIIKKFTFSGCKYLKKVNISNDSNLEIIDEFSFAGDISLEIINIPKSIINIYPTAFINTPSLISIMSESNDKYYVMNDDEIYLKNDINLELIFVPRYLKQIKIIQSCSKINSGSFCGSNIEDIIFPDLSLTTIGYCAFAHSTGLKKIVLPQSINKIEDEAFIDCQNLEIVEFDHSCQLKEIPKYCFAFSSLISIYLPDSIEIINDSAFYFCSNLKNIDILNTKIKYIGDSAFYETNIEKIIFPSTIKYISNHSFQNTKSLKLIDISRIHLIKNYERITQNLKSFHSFLSKMKRIKAVLKPPLKNKKSNLSISNTLILQAYANSPLIIKPNQPNQIQKIKQSKTNVIINSPRKLLQSPRNVHNVNKSRKENREEKLQNVCYIHESAFNNSFVNIIICNLDKYKWFKFFDKCSKIEEYIVNPNIHLYLKKLNKERKLMNNANKFEILIGNLYKVSKLEWKNDDMLLYRKSISKSLSPFHFLSSIKLTKIILSDDLKIKSIPKCVFSFTHIKEITIPSTVLEIKISAFKYCNELEIVKFLPNSKLNRIGSFAFYGCCNLKEISIPNNIKSIPFKCFAFSGLHEFSFPNSIIKVDKMAFFYCKNLTKIKFNEGLMELDDYSFANNNSLQTIDLPDSLEKINTKVFANCTNLRNVNTTENTKLIEIYNFSFENTKIENLKLNPNIKKLFEPRNVSQLKEISFYKGELIHFKQFQDGSIYEYNENSYIPTHEKVSKDDIATEKSILFEFIMNQPKNYKLIFAPKNLKSLKIQECCSSIGNYVLNGMKNLKTIEYINMNSFFVSDFPNHYNNNDNIKHIRISSKYSYFSKCKFSYFNSLEVVEFGELTNIFFIPKFAFENCYNLKKVFIPNCCTLFEEGSFKNCINLASIEFKSVKNGFEFTGLSIEKEAFYNCSSLIDITIPSVISNIGKNAFMNCTNLKHFEIENNNNCALCSIGESSFQNCSSLEKISFSTYAFYISIGNSAFMNCVNLKEVSIKGRSLYNIDFRAFYNCTSLLSFEFTCNQISNNLSYFDYIFLGFESFMNCSSIEKIILDISSADIEKIEKSPKLKLRKQSIQRKAFANCKSLKEVQLLIGNLQEIQENAFFECSSLKKLEIKSDENLFLPKNFNQSAFNNVLDDFVIKLIKNKEEIGSLKVSNLMKNHKMGIKTFTKYSSHLKKHLNDSSDDDLESNAKIKFSDKKMCFLFTSKKKYLLCGNYYSIPSIFTMTVPIKIRNRFRKSIFDYDKDYVTEYKYMPALKPPLNIYK